MYTVHVWGFSITSTIWDPSNVLRNYILFNLLVAKKYVVALLCCTVAKVICLPGNQAHWLCVCIFIIHHSPVSTLLSCLFCSIWCWIWFKLQKLLKCEPGALTSHLHHIYCTCLVLLGRDEPCDARQSSWRCLMTCQLFTVTFQATCSTLAGCPSWCGLAYNPSHPHPYPLRLRKG